MSVARPGGSVILDPLRRFWREYTRMRTAIYLLIAVAFIVLIGSFVPQQDTSAQTAVDAFLADHRNLYDLSARLGLPLTQVFIAPVFFVLVGSLYLALGACVVRRLRALITRTIRLAGRDSRRNRGAAASVRWSPQFVGEWGSWLFHASFFLLLVAVLVGKATGFQGLVTITEGQRFTEDVASYDTLQQGILFNRNDHTKVQVQLNSFQAGYQASGEARDYVSNVTVYDQGQQVMTRDIRVNDFLAYRDVDYYQQDFGWAPHMVVRNPAGQVVFDNTIQFFGQQKNVQTGVLKVPAFGYTVPGAKKPLQIGARVAVFPDARTIQQLGSGGTVDPSAVEFGPGGNEARNPVLQVQLFVGDLGLGSGTPQDVNNLDTSNMQSYFADAHPVPLQMGRELTLQLPGADKQQVPFTVSFPELRQYSLFMVKKDNGVPFIYLSFGLIMSGLLVKLYARPLLESRSKRRARALSGGDAASAKAPGARESEEGGVSQQPEFIPRGAKEEAQPHPP